VKLPRDLSGSDLAKKLTVFGYSVTRQTGSLIRLTTDHNGQHHITIPEHDPLKIGTLSGILNEIAVHHKVSKEELIQKLF
jgi:predicted RNA binding protein YcfA (HicA-like mRNA interferase family)